MNQIDIAYIGGGIPIGGGRPGNPTRPGKPTGPGRANGANGKPKVKTKQKIFDICLKITLHTKWKRWEW